jgi:cytochrome b
MAMRDANEIQVWDLLVRIFHWSLAAAFVVAYVTEDEMMTLHVYAGYLIAGLLVFRVIWGFIGPRHARFSDFVYTPAEVLGYLKDMVIGHPARYLGHNPAGGVMIVLLLVSLVVTVITGLLALGGEAGTGVLASTLAVGGGDGGEAWEEVHEFFGNFTLFLVVLHVAGVILGGRLHREDLVRAMVTGKKKVNPADTPA